MFRVQTWNICSNANKQFDATVVAAVIANQNPHVALLQEVRRDRLDQLVSSLHRRGWRCRSYLAVARTLSTVGSPARDYGVAIITRVPITSPVERQLHAPHLEHPGHALRMIAAPGGGAKPVYVYSLHLAVDTKTLDQAVDAHAFCALGGSPRKVIGGDFNLERPQLESTFYADYVEADASSPTPTYQSKTDRSWHKIDHMLLGGGIAASRCVVPNSKATSDHRPLVADLVV